jgi:hypothetical protein
MKKIPLPKAFKVEIGIWRGVTYPDGGESVAQVAAWNVEGTKRMPARDFLRFYLDRLREESLELAIEITKRTNRGENADAIVDIVGINGRNIVMEAITDLRTPPNSPATIKKKRSSNPLIDTGLMRQSVTWKVTKK